MRAILRLILAGSMGSFLLAAAAAVQAGEAEISVTPAYRYTLVDGDREKYRALHWMSDRNVGGIENFSARGEGPWDTLLSAHGHALVGNNDYGAEFSLKKEGLGFLALDYNEFRKYYDGTGGTYRRFASLSANELDKELALDVGKLAVEAGLTLENLPELLFEYEREFKDGAKSRLSWATVKEDSISRNIGPAWQDVDETVDTFAVKTRTDLLGVNLKAEQKWEFFRAESLREERSQSNTAAASDKKVRRQDLAPESNLMTTNLAAERWFFGEKLFVASGYRYAHMDNREFESIIETNAAGVLTNFSSPKAVRNARSDTDYDTHTWVSSASLNPVKWLSVVTNFKGELLSQKSGSRYPQDASPSSAGGSTPDGVIDLVVDSANKNKAARMGEGISLRFFGIPFNTALYTDLELEQSRIALTEDRSVSLGASADDVFNRKTITDVDKMALTLGTRSSPWRFLDVTAHLRHRLNQSDYDDQTETNPGTSTAKSAFMDEQNVETNEAAARITWKPFPWLKPSFRYQFRADNFLTRAEAQKIVTTDTDSHTLTWDLSLQPLTDLTTSFSYSKQIARTKTPAALTASGNTPNFNADSDSVLASIIYTPKEALTLDSTFLFSRADNFDNFAARNTGLPLGASYDRYDATAGLTWVPAEDWSVRGEYAFASYRADEYAEEESYDAHSVLVEAARKF